MAECPDCGGELQPSADHERSEGKHRMLKCNDCGTLFEPEEVH